MAALDVGVYDNFVSDTLQSEMSDLRVLGDNEVELVNGQFLLPGAGAVVIGGLAVAAAAAVIGFGIGYWMNRDPQPPPPPEPPAPPRPPAPYSGYW